MTDDKTPLDKPQPKKPDAPPTAKPRDIIPVKALRLRSDRPLELPGGQPPTFSVTTNEFFLVEFHPAMQMYRIVYTPRAGSSGQPWERFVPASWGSFERAPL